jgi:hypothetical protein
MTSDVWAAVAGATGMWITGAMTLINTDGRHDTTGVVWTSASSDKVASHPTLVRRSLPSTPTPMRTAALPTN